MHVNPYFMCYYIKFDYKVATLISNTFQRNITNGGEIPKPSFIPNVFDTHVAEMQYICSQKEKMMLQNIMPSIYCMYI